MELFCERMNVYSNLIAQHSISYHAIRQHIISYHFQISHIIAQKQRSIAQEYHTISYHRNVKDKDGATVYTDRVNLKKSKWCRKLKKHLQIEKEQKTAQKLQLLRLDHITNARKMLYVNTKQQFTCQYDVIMITFDALDVQQYPMNKHKGL